MCGHGCVSNYTRYARPAGYREPFSAKLHSRSVQRARDGASGTSRETRMDNVQASDSAKQRTTIADVPGLRVAAMSSSEKSVGLRGRDRLRASMHSIPADVTVKDEHGRYLMIDRAMMLERERPASTIPRAPAARLSDARPGRPCYGHRVGGCEFDGTSNATLVSLHEGGASRTRTRRIADAPLQQTTTDISYVISRGR